MEAGDRGESAAAADSASGERRPVSAFLNWVCGGKDVVVLMVVLFVLGVFDSQIRQQTLQSVPKSHPALSRASCVTFYLSSSR